MFVRSSVFCICVLVIMFLISPILAGVAMGFILPIVIFASFFGIKVRKLRLSKKNVPK